MTCKSGVGGNRQKGASAKVGLTHRGGETDKRCSQPTSRGQRSTIFLVVEGSVCLHKEEVEVGNESGLWVSTWTIWNGPKLVVAGQQRLGVQLSRGNSQGNVSNEFVKERKKL